MKIPTRTRVSPQSPAATALIIALTGFTALSGLLMTGCGSADTESAQADLVVPNIDQPLNQPTNENVVPPTEVVGLFLDAVRRDENSAAAAANLLSDPAQQHLANLDRQLQPFGSPEAQVKVLRSANIPDAPGNVLVETSWKEPEDEAPAEFVWTLRKQESGWRITGMVVQEQPDAQPISVDFENLDELKTFLGMPAAPAAEVAAKPQG